jgi:hypothetical protein
MNNSGKDSDIIVDISAKPGIPEIVENEFINELLAQSLREEVVKNTIDIRKLIISRALSSTIISPVSRDRPNLDFISDFGEEIQQILTPWKAE